MPLNSTGPLVCRHKISQFKTQFISLEDIIYKVLAVFAILNSSFKNRCIISSIKKFKMSVVI